MTAAPAAGDDPLVAFLGYLARHGFQVGARELMRANELMLALLSQGRLPERLSDRMALLQPLLCRSAQQQADFQRLLRQWVPEATQPGAGWRRRRRQAAADRPVRDTLQRWPASLKWGLAALLLAVALGVAVGARTYCEQLGWCKPPPPPVVTPIVPPEDPDRRASDPGPDQVDATPPADPPGHLPLTWVRRDPGRIDAWLDLAGGAAMLILLSMAGLMLLRRLALQPLRTDAWLDQRHLFAPRMRLLPRVPALLRQVTRELRRPRRTDRQELDIAQTIAATVRRGGAFEPRYRPRSGTPEYLVLIDRHGPNDQLAQVAEDLVGVLHRQGVALQAWRFNRDPSVCQPLRLDGRGSSRTRLRFAELALRHEGHRLLVFADAAQFADPLDGGLREGLDTLASGFAATMLFTPQPVPGWGAAEQALAASGVLVLPLQLGGLASGADWLSSQRALLMLEPDWPSTFPPRLQQHALLWTARADPPPESEVDGLLFELQLYLGERRFQWLCGCATFPVPSWPVTLVLAPMFMQPGDDAVTGAVALASLPWFREGSWPQWLRQALMQRLAPDKAEAVAAELRRRLDAASLGQAPQGQAGSLAEVALAPGLLSRLRRWWRRFSTDSGVRRSQGRLRRDVLFLGFIQRGIAQRLIQVVPEGLRRQVFREGLPLLGLRPWLPATLLLLALLGVAAQLPPLRDRVVRAAGNETGPALEEVARYASPTGAPATQLAFSPDGRWLAAGFSDGRVVMLRRDGSLDAVLRSDAGGPVSQLHFSVNGSLLAWVRQKDGANAEVLVATRSGSRMDHDLGAGEVGMVMASANGEAGAQARPGQPLRTIPVRNEASGWPVAGQSPVLLAGFDGTSWLYTTADGGVRLQADSADPKRSRAVDIRELRAGTARVAAMAVDRPRGRLAIAAGNRVLVLKDRGSSVEARFSDLKAAVAFLSFSTDGRQLLASLANGAASALPLGSDAGRDFSGEIGTPSRAEFVGDGSQIVQFGSSQVFVWSAAGGLPPSVTRVRPAAQPVGAISPDGRQIAVVGTDGAVRVLGERREVVAGSHWQLAPEQAADPASAPASAASAPGRRVPPVLGMTQRAAVEALASAGLKARVVLAQDPSMCAGVVIAQPSEVAASAPVEISVADNKTAFYDLTCRGGGMQTRAESGARPGFARVWFRMTAAGTAPAGDGLAPGQCSWTDRGFRPGEPLDVEVDVPASRAQPLIKTLHDGGRYLVFKATNLGKRMRAGCVTSASADPNVGDAGGAQQAVAVTVEPPASAPSSGTVPADTGNEAELQAVRGYFGAKSDAAFNLQAARDIANRLGPAADTLALAMAIAKTESGDFRPRTEQQNATNTSGKSSLPFDLYEPDGGMGRALGNTESGDGERYRGRGILMVVGRGNYRMFGSMADLGDRLVEFPAMLAMDEPARAVLVAAVRPLIRQLSRPLDEDGVRKIQRSLNGRTNADLLLRNYRDALPVAEVILRSMTRRSKS